MNEKYGLYGNHNKVVKPGVVIGDAFHHWKGNTLTPTQYTPVVITPKGGYHYYSADDNFVGIADDGTYLLEPRE